jgi:mannose-6-phosphate isomerase-like protein (cupin superfamily)
MNLRRRSESPEHVRGGQVSHILFAPQLGSRNLTVTWVFGAPGSQQGLHAHPNSEQIYVIVRGRGLMIVDDDERNVEAGDAILIHPGQVHAIRCANDQPLEYISATAPPFEAVITDGQWAPG